MAHVLLTMRSCMLLWHQCIQRDHSTRTYAYPCTYVGSRVSGDIRIGASGFCMELALLVSPSPAQGDSHFQLLRGVLLLLVALFAVALACSCWQRGPSYHPVRLSSGAAVLFCAERWRRKMGSTEK